MNQSIINNDDQSKLNQVFQLSANHKRKLGYAEFGPSNGRLVICLHGAPGCRLLQIPNHDESLTELGIRLVCIDRPGYGLSTYGGFSYSLLDTAKDIGELAQNLLQHSPEGQEQTFDIIGLSAGGPYALGVAILFPNLVKKCILVSSSSSFAEMSHHTMFHGMTWKTALEARLQYYFPSLGYVFARIYAWLLRIALQRWGMHFFSKAFGSHSSDALIMQSHLKEAEGMVQSLIYSLKDTRAYAHDSFVSFSSNWGFTLADVHCPVDIWHGTADPVIPVAHAHHLAEHLPSALLHEMPGKGHLFILESWKDVLM